VREIWTPEAKLLWGMTFYAELIPRWIRDFGLEAAARMMSEMVNDPHVAEEHAAAGRTAWGA
jgi:hypothetical protein